MRLLHLDPVGGIAGDMFAAAMIDAFPELEKPCAAVLKKTLGDQAEISVSKCTVDGLYGSRFRVNAEDSSHARNLRDILELIEQSSLSEHARDIARNVFGRLGEAEAAIHHVDIDDIHFHEVGAIDSIADIMAAAFLIDAVGPAQWSIDVLPKGGGRVRTEHGLLPVPAPATALLLKDFKLIDDGVEGERVTPTGAAILAYLQPRSSMLHCNLKGQGFGFGTRKLAGIPNTLRLLVAEASAYKVAFCSDRIGLLEFDIDDQTSEDLAIALDNLRSLPPVRDIVQFSGIGKKGRAVASIRIMCDPDQLDHVAERIFMETATIGIRLTRPERFLLNREHAVIEGMRVKIAERPGGRTAKIEANELADKAGGMAGRQEARAAIETAADGTLKPS